MVNGNIINILNNIADLVKALGWFDNRVLAEKLKGFPIFASGFIKTDGLKQFRKVNFLASCLRAVRISDFALWNEKILFIVVEGEAVGLFKVILVRCVWRVREWGVDIPVFLYRIDKDHFVSAVKGEKELTDDVFVSDLFRW